jgi:lipid-A-disaccharide synthase
MTASGPKIMIVAGETSGDRHGAKLAAELLSLKPDASLFGSAGPRMREAGVDAVVAADDLSVVGILEIAGSLPMFLSAFRKLAKAADERKPDVAVLIDFPEFNLKLARSLKKRGIKVVYYISPQLWAWRKYRIRTIRRYVDLVLTILPFEKEWYREQGIEHVEYVGSPLAREIHADRTRVKFCEDHRIDPERPIAALLPGSRGKEIQRILPVMLNAAELMASEMPGCNSSWHSPRTATVRPPKRS